MNLIEEAALELVSLQEILDAQDNDYDRFILIMVLYGYSHSELAEAMGKTRQAVTFTLMKCRQKAQQKLTYGVIECP